MQKGVFKVVIGCISIINIRLSEQSYVHLRQLRTRLVKVNKKLRYRRGTTRCVVSTEILPTATQQCRNYLYDKS